MRRSTAFCFLIVLVSCAKSGPSQSIAVQSISGLESAVEIYRDKWGINHIYASNQEDLFFAQGYAAAKDRLFQFEIWRRQATGTLAEILGPSEVARDVGARLFQFRGDMQAEMNHYHEDGQAIIEAYVAGINAYIEEIIQSPEALPLPFKMLGIQPMKWTPEVVVSRHQGLLGNIGQELQIGRAVAEIGVQKVKELMWFHPQDPILELDNAIQKDLLFEDILAPYFAFRKPVRFQLEQISKQFRSVEKIGYLNRSHHQDEDSLQIGSNNWVVAPEKSVTGYTLMANDPHRRMAIPSLRYMVHLNAPTWNVIGGGEPTIPGISIGHNQYGAWGLTVYRTDGEDLLQYKINPKNPQQYWFDGAWKEFKIITETIAIKDQPNKEVNLYYSHHGPITYINRERNIAFGVRCAWLEPGGSPYLASLRMDQATNWDEFRLACSYSNIPGENMVWADQEGTIGWQAVGIAPIRKNFSGLVPVPGDGSHEWEGYLPILEKPHQVNPQAGFIATANQNVTPNNYEHWDAIGFSWSDPYRGARINEVLQKDKKFTMEEMKALQTDVYSIPARTFVPLLENLKMEKKEAQLRDQLLDWDFTLSKNSIEASIYVVWENEMVRRAKEMFFPKNIKAEIQPQLKKVEDWIVNPKLKFGNAQERDIFLQTTFKKAIEIVSARLGKDVKKWQYGQPQNKHIAMVHPLGIKGTNPTAQKLNLPPLPRGGNGYTPNSTGNNWNQSSGASFRIIIDTGDWDRALGINAPGQSGHPASPFYSNLYPMWADDDYFPLYFSKPKIKEALHSILRLQPK